MAAPRIERFIGDEDEMWIWWTRNGSLIDFSSGYTFAGEFASADDLTESLFSKSSGFTGAAGSGNALTTSGVPNLVVTWPTSGELNAIEDPGVYVFQIAATKVSTGAVTTAHVQVKLKPLIG